jgi:uncharacterized protein YdeI (YjbR/CyaY-like superfamily)
MNTESVDAFLRDGCGRCEHYRTPACKVLRWTAPLVALRALAREAGLTEEMKWGHPTYTVDGRNVVILGAFKDRCTVSFVEGAGLPDPGGLLERPGPNSHRDRLVAFRSLEELEARREQVRSLLAAAVAFARSGERLPPRTEADPVPAELEERLAADPALRTAWDALTPGRRRSHVLHVSGAARAETRLRRAERCAPDILAGKGFQERPK